MADSSALLQGVSPETVRFLAKIAGIVSSGFFAGFTWTLSSATLPTILAADLSKESITELDGLMLGQWRLQYLKGFKVSIPTTIINLLSWSILAFTSSDHFLQKLYVTAAVATGSGTVFAWTALRAVNGALALKARKHAGPDNDSIALTYSLKERTSINLEKEKSPKELMVMWMNYNEVRSLILLVGTIIGAFALALDHA